MTPDDSVFFKKKLWFRISRWTWVRLAFAFMLCTSGLGLYQVQKNSEQDAQRFKDVAYAQCDRGNNVRQVIRDIISVTYSSGNSLNLSILPHYTDLDPTTKAFVDDLNLVLSSNASPEAKQQRIDAALLQVPLVDCESVSS